MSTALSFSKDAPPPPDRPSADDSAVVLDSSGGLGSRSSLDMQPVGLSGAQVRSSVAEMTSPPPRDLLREFWAKQHISKTANDALYRSWAVFLTHGVSHSLPGVRVDADLASKFSNRDTIIFANGKGQISLPWSPPGSGDRKKEHRDIVYDDIKKAWPAEMQRLAPSWERTELLRGDHIQDALNSMGDPSQRASFLDWTLIVAPYKSSLLLHPGHFKGSWPLSGARVSLKEFGFTRFGFPSLELDRQLGSAETALERWPRIERHFGVWREELGAADVYGRSWTISPTSSILPWAVAVLASSQVALGHDLETFEVGQCAACFTARYAKPWPTATWTNWCCVGDVMLHAQFHMRAMVVGNVDSSTRRTDGLLLVRRNEIYGHELDSAAAQLAGPGRKGASRLELREARTSVAILTSIWDDRPPHYTMVTLTDTETTEILAVDCIDAQGKWAAHGVRRLSNKLLGLAIFQLAVGRMISVWATQWRSTLDAVAAPCSRQGQVDPGGLTATRHLLLRSRRMIQELGTDLRSMVRDVTASMEVVDGPTEAAVANWDAICDLHARSEAPLLADIAQRLEELAPQGAAVADRVQAQTREGCDMPSLPLSAVAVAAALLILGWSSLLAASASRSGESISSLPL